MMASGLDSEGIDPDPPAVPRRDDMPSEAFLGFEDVLFLGEDFFGFSSTTVAATRRLLLSNITVVTISVTICFSSSKNCRASYLCC